MCPDILQHRIYVLHPSVWAVPPSHSYSALAQCILLLKSATNPPGRKEGLRALDLSVLAAWQCWAHSSFGVKEMIFPSSPEDWHELAID